MPDLVSQALRAHSAEFRDRVLGELYTKHPETRLWFPAHAEDAHQNLVFALTYLLDNEPNEELVANLAREHRAFGLTPPLALSGLEIMSKAMHSLCADLPHPEVAKADSRLAWVGKIMADTLADTPSPGWGTVVDVQRRARRVTVVRLECPEPPRYLPGQYFAVSSPLIQGYWPHLAPAMPENAAGFLEFHLNDSPAVAGLAVSKPGDQWFFGPAHGNLAVSGTADVLMVAQGTGLAPLRAIILDLLARGNAQRVHLFFGAEFPGELYELAGLWHLAGAAPWLSVTPVAEKSTDEWWVAPTEHATAPRGLHLQQQGTLAEAVTSWGSWGDREVLLSGTAEWAESMRAAMLAAGTPAENIQVLAL